jgi:adenylate cyclase class IV
MHSYEVEIKVLLWEASAKDAFMERVRSSFPTMTHEYSESQLNHYFEGGNLRHLLGTFREYISQEQAESLHRLSGEAKGFSVRTRGTPTQTIIVVKATVNDESSSNGTARIEWEVDLAPMTLDDMDKKVLAAGFAYQAKWSRAREWYKLNDDTVLCLDKNAGYGYLAEFERVIDDASLVDSTRTELLTMIESLGYHELDQARLARMFEKYNREWQSYYGTENVFTVE